MPSDGLVVPLLFVGTFEVSTQFFHSLVPVKHFANLGQRQFTLKFSYDKKLNNQRRPHPLHSKTYGRSQNMLLAFLGPLLTAVRRYLWYMLKIAVLRTYGWALKSQKTPLPASLLSAREMQIPLLPF